MIYKEIDLIELFNLIDEWFDKKETPFIRVENKNGANFSGEVDIPNNSSYYLPQNRPCYIRISEQSINLTQVKSLEVADVKYVVVK